MSSLSETTPKGISAFPEPNQQAIASTNHLLLIAIDKYEKCPTLKTCVSDAEAFKKVLVEKYQFEDIAGRVTWVQDENATREGILKALRKIRMTFNQEPGRHNLVVYFAGHGWTEDGISYWVPKEGAWENEHTLISISELTDKLEAIRSFHTLLIVDACFAGSIFRGGHYSGVENLPSRWCITSCHSKEMAADGKEGEKSPFAKCLIETLDSNHESLSVQALGEAIRQRVERLTSPKQTPLCRPLKVKGDDHGQFIFHRKIKEVVEPDDVKTLDTKPPISTLPSLLPTTQAKPFLYDCAFVKGGSYQRGTAGNEDWQKKAQPVRQVTVQSFWMGKCPVTFSLYDSYVEEVNRQTHGRLKKPSDGSWGREKRPVIHVSWFEAVGFCNWLSKKEGFQTAYSLDISKLTATLNPKSNGYRLPTEAEWEYVAKGGNQPHNCRYAGSDNLDEVGWYFENSSLLCRKLSENRYQLHDLTNAKCGTHEVGKKAKLRGLDIYDLSGNVWEWVEDCWSDDYEYAPVNGSPWVSYKPVLKVRRGGNWGNTSKYCQVSFRDSWQMMAGDDRTGFRCVRNS